MQIINAREDFQANRLNADFFRFFEMDADFPDDWKLEINVKSKSEGGSDPLIGSTIIDLEDRYMGENSTYQRLKLKSLEQVLMNIVNS